MTSGTSSGRVPTAATPSNRVPVAIAIAAFTPYLGLPIDIRYEHLVIYGLAIAAIAARAGGLAPRADVPTRRLVLLWAASGALITLNTFIFRSDLGTVERIVFTISVLDSFLLPLAAFLALTTYGLRRDVDARDGLRAACAAVVVGLSLNSLLILLFDVSEVQPVLRLFWSNEASPYLYIEEVGGFTSVAARTIIAGRYGGIFNQPYDGGLGYAVGVAAWFVLYTRRARGVGLLASPITQYIALALIVAGGLSTLSKVFIYGAPLVALASLGLPLTGTRTTVGRSLAVLIAAPFATVFVARNFLPETGERAFGLLSVYGEEDAAYLATGGRVSDFALYPDKILRQLSLFGRGWGGIRDDAFLAFMQGGGPVGLLIYLIILTQLFRLAFRLPAFSVERRLALSLALLAAFSSLGAVPLQVNRGSSLLWLLVSLLFARAQRFEAAARWGRRRDASRPLPRQTRSAPAQRSGRPSTIRPPGR